MNGIDDNSSELLHSGLTPEQVNRLSTALDELRSVSTPTAQKHRLLHPEFFSPLVRSPYLAAAKYLIPAVALLILATFIPEHKVPETNSVAQTQVESSEDDLVLASLLADGELVDDFELDLFDSELDIIEEVI